MQTLQNADMASFSSSRIFSAEAGVLVTALLKLMLIVKLLPALGRSTF